MGGHEIYHHTDGGCRCRTQRELLQVSYTDEVRLGSIYRYIGLHVFDSINGGSGNYGAHAGDPRRRNL